MRVLKALVGIILLIPYLSLFANPSVEIITALVSYSLFLVCVYALVRIYRKSRSPEALAQRETLRAREREQYAYNMANPKQVQCPHCGSTSLSANKKGFGFGKAAGGAVLFGLPGLLAGGIGSGKVKVTCLNCGHQWTI